MGVSNQKSLSVARPTVAGSGGKAAFTGTTRDTKQLDLLFCTFILVAVGRITELIPGLGGLPLAKLTMGMAIIGLIARWKELPEIAASIHSPLRTMKWLVALTLLSVPFSVWFVPSIQFLYQMLPILVTLVLFAVKLSHNWVSLKRMTLAFVLSGTVLAVNGLTSFGGGRLSAGVMYDTNDIAFALVLTLPMALAFFFGATHWKSRAVYLGVSCILAVSILLTSSRGGFLGLATIIGLVALRPIHPAQGGPGKKRKSTVAYALRGVVVAIPLAVLTWPLLPYETRERLATIVNLESDYNLDARADQGRSQIWKRGLLSLADRPLGSGISAYPMVDYRAGGRMQAPHNSLLQITVELGVIGGLLYLRMYWLLWAGLGAAYTRLSRGEESSPEDTQRAILCRMMQVCLVASFVSSFFLSMAYAPLLWIAFAIALGCAQQEPISKSSAAEKAAGRRESGNGKQLR